MASESLLHSICHLKMESMKLLLSIALLAVSCRSLYALNSDSDTIPPIQLSGVEIATQRIVLPMHRLPNVHGSILVAGKKNEVIELSKSTADLASVNQRQIFARVPGLMIWENDGSGIQIGIAARGLSPNRSWEFNTRQNGYDISPDVFGYPEAYYSPPMEAIDRIEFLRGSASLQFGPQFGGMVNYVMKSGHGDKPIFYESRQSVGSYGLFSTYHAVGGTKNKWSYYAFAQQRRGDGWRKNSNFDSKTIYGSVEYRHNSNLLLGLNITHSQFLSQQPGGLTDEQFKHDWRSSSRSRNWLQVPWNVASLYAKVRTSGHSLLDIKLFGLLADRSSVGFMKAITVADTINESVGTYSNRKLDIDQYQTWGAELRWLLEYDLFGREHQLATGMRYSDAHTHRRNDGVGSTGPLFDIELAEGEYGKNLFFDNVNAAAYVENIFHLGNRLTLTPALRMEDLHSQTRGYISLTEGDFLPLKRRRSFILAGLGLQYEWSNVNVYANASQAYRPVTFGDFTPGSTTDVIDPNLKDASGYNAECGVRGMHKNWLNFDAGLFYLSYDNRIGTVQREGVNYKTNIGKSISKGVEIYMEIDPVKMLVQQPRFGSVSFFVSGTIMDARYVRWDNPAIAEDPSKSIENKRIEYAPTQSWRAGATYKVGELILSAQWSKVGSVFTDASNTYMPTANAQAGKIDTYELWDASIKYNLTKSFFLQAAVNNALNERYATRRAGGYPGPGLLPGNGRTVTLTLGLNL
jgi:Fe(3+) dicitrate transport protein